MQLWDWSNRTCRVLFFRFTLTTVNRAAVTNLFCYKICLFICFQYITCLLLSQFIVLCATIHPYAQSTCLYTWLERYGCKQAVHLYIYRLPPCRMYSLLTCSHSYLVRILLSITAGQSGESDRFSTSNNFHARKNNSHTPITNIYVNFRQEVVSSGQDELTTVQGRKFFPPFPRFKSIPFSNPLTSLSEPLFLNDYKMNVRG